MTNLDDWNNVTVKYVKDNGGASWLMKYKDSLVKALKDIYPHHNWEATKSRTALKSQSLLYLYVI